MPRTPPRMAENRPIRLAVQTCRFGGSVPPGSRRTRCACGSRGIRGRRCGRLGGCACGAPPLPACLSRNLKWHPMGTDIYPINGVRYDINYRVQDAAALRVRRLERRGDGDTTPQCPRRGADIGVKTEHSLGRLALRGIQPQVIRHVNPADDEHLPVQLHLPDRVRRQPALSGRDPARLQRAPEGAGESPCRRSHDVVQRRGSRRVDARVDAVVLRYLGVHTEDGRSLLRG